VSRTTAARSFSTRAVCQRVVAQAVTRSSTNLLEVTVCGRPAGGRGVTGREPDQIGPNSGHVGRQFSGSAAGPFQQSRSAGRSLLAGETVLVTPAHQLDAVSCSKRTKPGETEGDASRREIVIVQEVEARQNGAPGQSRLRGQDMSEPLPLDGRGRVARSRSWQREDSRVTASRPSNGIIALVLVDRCRRYEGS